MKWYSILFLLMVLFVTEAASDCLNSKKTLSTYTWVNFFNNGCRPVTEIIDNGNQKATLVYHCWNNEKIKQSARLYRIKGGVFVWVSQLLPKDQLRTLSNSKCQASRVFQGSDHVTINFTCALLNLIVGYDISSCLFSDDFIRIGLIPVKVLIIYGNGTQEFSVNGEELIPLGTFQPFVNRLTK